MLEVIQDIDQQLFVAMNQGLINPLLDWSMPIVTGTGIWIAAIACYALFLVYKKDWKKLRILVAMGVVLAIADFSASHIIKPLVGRLRPCKALSFARTLAVTGCAGPFGFPSNHATNAMVIVTWLSLVLKKRYVFLIAILALIVGFSRIYLGVHYPLDILMGYTYGLFLSLISMYFFRKNHLFFDKNKLE